MENRFNVKLAKGSESTVIFYNSLDDLIKYTESYGENVFSVIDENASVLLNSIPEKSIIIPSGEKYKNIDTLMKIIRAALSSGAARDTRFIAFGGGVVCDMAALASSLYMRGAKLTLIPTTLLCMVDATLGGKTAIDFEGGKNLVGTFYPASEVLISIETLKTLNDKEYLSGLGEVIKHAYLTQDLSLLNYLKTNREKILKREKDVLNEVVYYSLMVKKNFIEADPLETKGIRSFLNLGHTFAHALESTRNYSISHGEAVAWGLGRALEGSANLSLIGEDVAKDGIKLLKDYGYKTDYRVEKSEYTLFSEALKKDKKKSKGTVKYVLLEGIGKPVLKELSEKEVQKLVLNY